MTPLRSLADWASALTLDQAPQRVIELAKTQVLSQLAAIRAGLSHPLGQRVVDGYGPPLSQDPARSAFVLAGQTSWMHFDDTAYAGHLSNSTVNVPLAWTYATGLNGRQLLTAVLAANETAARITAATTLGPFRGQMAAHTHTTGAIAGRLRGIEADADIWVDALGLALAMPLWNITHGFMASDARVLSSSVPIRLGIDACEAAEAGFKGAPDILEHPRGFLARFARSPLPQEITAGLGKRWHTDTLSFKTHPSGPGTDSAVDCAIELHNRIGPVHIEDVSEIEVRVSLYTVLFQRAVSAYLADGPQTPISVLVSTTAYPVATALLTGRLRPADFMAPDLAAPDRWKLADRVRLVHDEDMTRALLASDAPFGAALRAAGDQGQIWLRDFGGAQLANLSSNHTRFGAGGTPSEDFTDAVKMTPARVTLRMTDGSIHSQRRDIPLGAAGAQSAGTQRQQMRAKFLATGGPEPVADAIDHLETVPAHQLRRVLRSAILECAQ